LQNYPDRIRLTSTNVGETLTAFLVVVR
jgi:hypothetical protein